VEDAPFDPLVNQAIERIESRLGRRLACPLCGGADWAGIGQTLCYLTFWNESFGSEPGTESDAMRSARVLPLSCNNCGYLWLHHISEEYVEANER
jgi:hypothetical protein